MKAITKKIGRFVTFTFFSVFILSIFLVLMISFPPVQNHLVRSATNILEDKLETRVELSQVNFRLPNRAELHDLIIYDRQDCEMISIKHVRLDLLTFSLFRLVLNPDNIQDLKVSKVELQEPRVILYKSQADSLMNIEFLTKRKIKEKKRNGTQLSIDLPIVTLTDGAFCLRDSLKPEVDSTYRARINFSNMWIEGIDGDLSFSMIAGGRLKVDIQDLNFREMHSGFVLDKLSTTMVSDTSHVFDAAGNCNDVPFLEFKDLNLIAQRSDIRATIRFENERLDQLFDPKPDEAYKVWFSGTKFDFSSLNYFVKKPLPVHGVVFGQGLVEGNFESLRSNGFKAKYRDETWLNADIRLDNFIRSKVMELRVEFAESSVSAQDLRALLPDVKLPGILDSIGRVDIDGLFAGRYYDFQADADIHTAVGNVIANLHMIIPPFAPRITYHGHITTRALNLNQLGLAKVLPSENFNFDGSVRGEGVKLEDLQASFEAEIIQSDLFGHQMEVVKADVEVAEKKVKGALAMKDEEGAAKLEVDLDMSIPRPTYIIKGNVDHLNFQRYGLLKEPIWFSSDLDIDLSGDSIDNFEGVVSLADIHFGRLKDSTKLDLERVSLQANRTHADSFALNLRSSLMDADLMGDFTLKRALTLSKRLVFESRLFFANDDSLISAYYDTKKQDSIPVSIAFNSSSNTELNSLFNFLRLPLFIAPGTSAEGTLAFDQFDKAMINLDLDSVAYEGRSFRSGAAYVDLTKYTDRNNLLLVGGASLSQLQPGPGLMLDTLMLDMQWFDNQIEYSLVTEQEAAGNKLMLQLTSEYFKDGRIVSSINPRVSNLSIGNTNWQVSEKNLITYEKRAFTIENFLLEADTQSVNVSGSVSKLEGNKLDISVSRLDLNALSELYTFKYDVNGTLYADIILRDLLADLKFETEASLRNLSLDEVAYGDLLVDADWEKGSDRIALDAHLDKDQTRLISLTGHYALKDKVSPLDFHLNSQTEVPLNYLKPFVKKQIYGIDGSVEFESFTITGHPSSPVVKGTGHIENAKFGVDYFKTEFSFDGDIVFDTDRITFPTITLYDKNKNTAEFYGVIRHRGLKEFVFDLQLDQISNFLIMDTKKADNEMFYGTIFVRDGVASITGTLEKIEIQAYALTGGGSVFSIPISDERNLERPEYIRFVGDKESEIGKVKTGIQGFELNLTVSATKDAEVNLIFDEKVGDIIKGNGEGNINLVINEEGEFSMFGDYVISEGEYLFTAQSIVNKKFLVKPEGTISWSGDPYDAELDLEAYYPLNADIKDFIQSDQSTRVPVNVLMQMTGSLLQPEIDLAIEMPNLNQQDAIEIVTYLKTIQYDEQELNKQIFSLMVFHRFAPVGGTLGQETTGAGVVTTSISELLSNQLNYWISQAMNDKVSVAVASNDLQDVELLVSARLFNDRVTIERDGTIVSQNENVTIGDIRLIVRLLPRPSDGSRAPPVKNTRPAELVLEVFSRERLDVNFENKYQAGAGLFFKKDFDTLSELIGRKKKRAN